MTLYDGNFFHLAGVRRPSSGNCDVSYAIITIEANPDIFFYQEHQGAVLRRRQNMALLDLTQPEDDLFSRAADA